MSDFNSVRCDACDRIKQEANKWEKAVWAYSGDGSVAVLILGDATSIDFGLLPKSLNIVTHDICSENCCHKYVDARYAERDKRKSEAAERDKRKSEEAQNRVDDGSVV